MRQFDLVIRGGSIIDGTGSDPRAGDIGICGGRIGAVGKIGVAGREEIDAAGLLVTPGFVDVHTHYDGQAIWAEQMAPSSRHGVTTAVMGNCGVGFAPCRPQDHAELITLMEGVEDIPEIVLREGLTWEWESFPEYLDQLETRRRDIDVAAYLPHSPLRTYVMGQRGLRRELATQHDLLEMQRLMRQAMQAGAMGFATSRTRVHRNGRGELIPSFETDGAELKAIGAVLKELGKGVIQFVPNVEPGAMRQDILLTVELARASGRPVMVSLVQTHDDPTAWREYLELIDRANVEEHLPVMAQIFPRATAAILGLSVSLNPFTFCASYAPLAPLPLAERVRELRRPQLRAKLLSEAPLDRGSPFFKMTRLFERMFVLEESPNYEPRACESVGAQARKRGVPAEELAYEILLSDEGRSLLYLPLANYADANLDAARAMMMSEHTVFGLGDGGAHYGLVSDAGYPTFLLAHWTRDRHTGRVPLPWAIKAMTRDTARAVGLDDRGVLAPGYKADLNILDYDGIKLHRPSVIADLPNGGRRLMEAPEGYVATIVNGKVTYRDGIATGELPGRLVRGPQVPPPP